VAIGESGIFALLFFAGLRRIPKDRKNCYAILKPMKDSAAKDFKCENCRLDITVNVDDHEATRKLTISHFL